MHRRLNRETRMKRNRRVRRFRFYVLIAFVITLSIFSFKFIEKNKGINEAAYMDKLSKGKDDDSAHVLVPQARS